MKKLLIAIAVLVGGATLVSVFNNARADSAASAIYADYKECGTTYPLLGKREQVLKNSTEEELKAESTKSTLEMIDRAETSCAKYNKYLDEWGNLKINPSEELVLALVSRYEPERLKRK